MTSEVEARESRVSERLVAIQEQLRLLQKEEEELIKERDFLLYDGWTRSHLRSDWICLESPGKEWAINAGRHSCMASLWRRDSSGYSTQQGEKVFLWPGTDEQLGKAALKWAKERISHLEAEQANALTLTVRPK